MFFFYFSPTLKGQSKVSQDLMIDVAYLSSDLLEGRGTGTVGEEKAAIYIASRFEELGLEAKGVDSWYQAFDFRYTSSPHAAANSGERIHGKNVIAYIDNQAENTIVFGAHYDHLGYGGHGSLHAGDDAIHNGADDNASGVAGIIEVARQLKESTLLNNNYLFIGFSGEEYGLYGSKYFIDNATIPEERISCMFNLDMVGRLDKDKKLVINGVGTSPAWKKVMDRLEGQTTLDVKTTDSGLGPSDHSSFYLADIPAIHFFTGQHTDYHKPGDDSQKVNYEGIQLIADYIVGMVRELDASERPKFTKTVDKQTRTVSSFKVTLGIMPDYVHEGSGVKIDAVLDERPAKESGMEGGDILVKLGDLEIEDIYAYMEALSKFEKGQTVKAIVLRGKKKVKMNVTF